MPDFRLKTHPILPLEERERVSFYFGKKKLEGRKGEVISSALFANGIHVFGHHPKDGSAQGIFCANGQCAQCTVLANGVPVKSCMVKVQEGMVVESVEGLPALPKLQTAPKPGQSRPYATDVLIIGGGPAGLSAAAQLGRKGIKTLVVDDKDRLGGKLLLQTHKFFGSIEDCNAGTRGMDIAVLLEKEVRGLRSVRIWLDSTAMYVFSDKKVGVLTQGRGYRIVEPKVVLVAAGAREKSLAFPGNTLPGVYGAGAFQTLVNRDLIKPAKRLFIAGGGNVGLIAAYHALQAGMEVAGLVEALEKCGGYKVHEDKIKRLGVPVYTRHTVLSANGKEHLESVTVGQIDNNFQPVPGTEKTYLCDTLLIAVGLSPVNEFILEAEQAGLKVFAAGDAKEIAEASSAIFSGKIAGLEIARDLGRNDQPIPDDWYRKAEILKSHPGPSTPPDYDSCPRQGITPVFHCTQEIPCNPCTSVCPKGVVEIPGDSLLGKPQANPENECIGCNRCLHICPGLAISLVDWREDPDNPVVSLAYEVYNHQVKQGDEIMVTSYEGLPLAQAQVLAVELKKNARKTQVVKVRLAKDLAPKAAGFKIQPKEVADPAPETVSPPIPDSAIVCRCERVTAGEIRELIRQGVTDLNQIKAVTRAGMGACGYKTCQDLMLMLLRSEGVDMNQVTLNTTRPVFVEAPLGAFMNADQGGDK